MPRSKLSGYMLMLMGVFFLGLSIPVFDQFMPEAAMQGGLLVNFIFLLMVVGAGVLFLLLAWNKLRGRRN